MINDGLATTLCIWNCEAIGMLSGGLDREFVLESCSVTQWQGNDYPYMLPNLEFELMDFLMHERCTYIHIHSYMVHKILGKTPLLSSSCS